MRINPKIKYYLLSLVSLAIIFSSIYYLLGGWTKLEVSEGGAVNYDIVGTSYKGRYVADSAALVFEDIKAKVTNNVWEGDLVEITYVPEEGDEINQFFGVLLTGRVTQIEGNYRITKIRAPGILQVALTMNWMVRPNREEIQLMFDSYARENGLEIESYFLQRYYPDNSVLVEAFVK